MAEERLTSSFFLWAAKSASLSLEELKLLTKFMGGWWRAPDLEIAPRGEPYLYRWHVVPRNDVANVYLHVQIADDPERPLHDHMYDNQSVVLAGGYEETYAHVVPSRDNLGMSHTRIVPKGATVHRKAEEAHRLRLLPQVPYTITLFSTGPRRREWGFWLEGGWVPWHAVTEGDYRDGGVSKWRDR